MEIIEKSAGPYKAWYRYRVFLPDRNSFTIQLATSKGLVTSDAPITEVGDGYEVGGPSLADSTHSDFDLGMVGFNRIARWSGQDLIPGGQSDSGGEPHP